jgi:hypothetical protein
VAKFKQLLLYLVGWSLLLAEDRHYKLGNCSMSAYGRYAKFPAGPAAGLARGLRSESIAPKLGSMVSPLGDGLQACPTVSRLERRSTR